MSDLDVEGAIRVRGGCACGGVRFEVDGEPLYQFYCHCRSCQIAHAAPLIAVAVFPADAVRLEGEVRQVTVTQTAGATPRLVCPQCGTKVINVPHASLRTILVPLCETRDWFRPTYHMQWRDRAVDVRDELPKYLDLPEHFGGTGELAP